MASPRSKDLANSETKAFRVQNEDHETRRAHQTKVVDSCPSCSDSEWASSSIQSSDSTRSFNDIEMERQDLLRCKMRKREEDTRQALFSALYNPRWSPESSSCESSASAGSVSVDRRVIAVPMGLSSLGAALHGSGKCKPCAWQWKPAGCRLGAMCDFCHSCPRGALRDQRKAKTQKLKQCEKQERCETAACSVNSPTQAALPSPERLSKQAVASSTSALLGKSHDAPTPALGARSATHPFRRGLRKSKTASRTVISL
eukprot:TRINITY_DN77957_c0_g1_i1.p1 TRINITY_DN77957_c0_g1~~TRINITY_DN77957_c0_g1_i1.p1  ORF type:complete len:265 (-),score=17.38 TRINITY_DN77957_c0_g1_i1:34-807(-)